MVFPLSRRIMEFDTSNTKKVNENSHWPVPQPWTLNGLISTWNSFDVFLLPSLELSGPSSDQGNIITPQRYVACQPTSQGTDWKCRVEYDSLTIFCPLVRLSHSLMHHYLYYPIIYLTFNLYQWFPKSLSFQYLLSVRTHSCPGRSAEPFCYGPISTNSSRPCLHVW